MADASWAWIVGALVVAQLPRLAQAVATLGSVPVRLPLGPVYGMQLAMSYMNVALPSNLARMAVNIRFFQRQGLSAPTAVASGAIDSFASTVVQALLLALLLIFSESSLALDLPFPSGGVRTLLWLLAGALVASILTLVLVRRLRELIAAQVRRWWPDVRAALGALRASHKLALLVLGSLATELLFAIALGLFARSFGYDVSLAELLVINISVSLLASLVPVPGGVGVAEFGLTARAHVGGHDAGAGGRRRAALPHRDLLSAAALGLLRPAVATAQPLPLTDANHALHDVEATVQAIPDRLQVQLGDDGFHLAQKNREIDVVDLRPGPDEPHVVVEDLPHRPAGPDARAELLDIGICRDLEEDHLAQLGGYVFHTDRVADTKACAA